MAKKRRSAKQKAATRKLVARNKKKAKKNPKRRTKRRTKASVARPKRKKTNKGKKPRKNVVSKKGLSKITGNPTLRKVLLAAGAVSIATSVAALVAPSIVPTLQNPIVRAGLGFVTGDFVGAASNFVLGGGGGLVGGNGSRSSNVGDSGFA